MADTNHFSPVILYSDDARAVHDALMSSGHGELAEKIRRKAFRSRLDRMYADLVNVCDENIFEADDEPVISQGPEGAYVMVWHWVYKDTIRKKILELKKLSKWSKDQYRTLLRTYPEG